METIKKHSAVCVLTARGIEKVLAEGGSQAWVLDAKRARACGHVVCVQNRNTGDDWGKASAPHHTAFLVGRLKSIVPCEEEGAEDRWKLVFESYAEIDISNAWPGYRNPVFYTSLEDMGIDFDGLNFQPMPEQEIRSANHDAPALLTIAQAKAGLALTFGVPESAIEIMIRG